jgi:NADP-dependent 3-hydroxy acid dehydrogenase YdfG
MPRNKSFVSKVVVVTGATAGVGRAVAIRFAREGAKLGLISRDRAALEALADELRAAGAEQTALAPLDVANGTLFWPLRTSSRASSAPSTSGSTTQC